MNPFPAATRPSAAGSRAGTANAAGRRRLGLLASVALTAGLVAAGSARGETPPEEIVVVGERLRTLPEPERTVSSDRISTYGLGTIGELLGEMAAEDGSAGEEAEILVDGRLSRGGGAIEDYPVESVERIEVLPPGSAGTLGGSRTAKAFNVVLKPRSRVLAVRAGHRFPTEGGWGSTSGDAGLTLVAKPRRINLSVGAAGDRLLRESERPVRQPAGSAPGIAATRSLRPSRRQTEGSLSLADEIAPWLRAALTMRLERAKGSSLLGPSLTGGSLDRRSRTGLGEANLLLEADWGSWLFALDGLYRERRRRTVTEREGGGRSTVFSGVRSSAVELSANGPLVTLPAGALRLTLAGGLSRESLDSRRDGESQGFDQTSRDVRLAIDLPVAGGDFLKPLGELSLGAEVRRGKVSGIGRSSGETVSARWQPARWLRLFGSVSNSRSPPSLELVSDPLIETPGVRYLDPLRNETVEVVALSGGNPQLPTATARDARLSLQVRPLSGTDLSLNADYLAATSRNQPAALPSGGTILAAFPERFTRDETGRLVQVDLRPLAFQRLREEQLRYGFNLSLPLSRGRIQVSASHSLLLTSELSIAPGLASVDLLSRDALALAGSRPRHSFDAILGYAERGLGARLTLERRTASFLDNSSGDRADVLRFAPLTTLGLRAFAEGGRLAPGLAWLRGARLALTVNNIANARERVRDGIGITPLSYQPLYRDPLGRTIEVEFRKAF